MPEATFTAHINSLGFRDRDFAIAKSRDTIRILVIGDSYTFGWGVDEQNAWPKVVERQLRAMGRPVEVGNLGWPGANATAYANTAERSIPVLHPDLVILGVLSGQDYSQEWWSTQSLSERVRTHALAEWPELVGQRVRREAGPLLSRIYPNATRLIARASLARIRAGETKTAAPRDTTLALGDSRHPQSAEAAGIERHFGTKQRERFARLDTAIVRMFRIGEVNPSLIYFAADRPELFAIVEQFQSSRGQEVVRSMARQFSRVRASADRYGARVIILSTPYAAYASRHDCENMTRFGYDCDAKMYAGDAADQSTIEAGKLAGIPVFAIADSFRKVAAQRKLFFAFDDHPNAAGYQLLGDLFTPIVAKVLPSRISTNVTGRTAP